MLKLVRQVQCVGNCEKQQNVCKGESPYLSRIRLRYNNCKSFDSIHLPLRHPVKTIDGGVHQSSIIFPPKTLSTTIINMSRHIFKNSLLNTQITFIEQPCEYFVSCHNLRYPNVTLGWYYNRLKKPHHHTGKLLIFFSFKATYNLR